MREPSPIIIAALVMAGIGGAWFWWSKQKQEPPPAPEPPRMAQPVDAAPAEPTPPAEPAIQHPIAEAEEPEPAAQPLPPLDESDAYIRNALEGLLGRKQVQSFLNLGRFARSFVATVDNLAREHAPLHLWPVVPTPGEFEAAARGGNTVIGNRNAARYAGIVRLAEGVDTRRLVRIYRRLYPLFQEAYVDLGYPGQYFNDRVVEVIDHLRATPTITEPIGLKLVELPEGQKATRRLYQFVDPALEARSAGQKILLRMGPENAARIKAKLLEVRRHITRNPR